MKVELNLEKGKCTVTREPGDKKFYSDSVLLHHIKLALIKQRHDVIKKRAWKDGHLVDNTKQYIRTRRGYKPSFYIFDGCDAIRFLHDEYDRLGKVTLTAVTGIWGEVDEG